VLALSSKPQQLIEMVLDELVNLLRVDYGWVQMVGSEEHDLQLVTSRGSTAKMTQVVGWFDSHMSLGERVMVGSKVVVPDLSRNSTDGLVSFALAGFRSLVAVPIRTYRTQGVIGVASSTKNHLRLETGELLMTIASMVNATLNVAELGSIALDGEKRRFIEEHLEAELGIDKDRSRSISTAGSESAMPDDNDIELPGEVVTEGSKAREDNAGDARTFRDHSRSMSAFHKTHGKG